MLLDSASRRLTNADPLCLLSGLTRRVLSLFGKERVRIRNKERNLSMDLSRHDLEWVPFSVDKSFLLDMQRQPLSELDLLRSV